MSGWVSTLGVLAAIYLISWRWGLFFSCIAIPLLITGPWWR